MADGNLGSLFMSLGIKDEMSNTLQKIIKEMKGVDQATLDVKKRGEELVNSINNINGSNFSKIFREANEYIEKNTNGVSGIVKMLNKLKDKDLSALTGKFLGSSDLTKLASILRTANSEFAKMSQNEETADRVKIWQGRISNALDYIKLLQDIDSQQRKISNTKAENPNVDTKSLDNARKSLAGIKSEIVSILSNGGVDDSSVLGGFRKLLTVAKNDVKEIVATFKKDNPFSAFTGGAAKVEADISRVTDKLGQLRTLINEGTRKGYDTSMLTGNITELENVLSRLQSAKLNPTMLTDAAQMRNLISDVLVEMTKATGAANAYKRAKREIVDAENEHKKVISEINSIQSGENRQKKTLTDIELLLKNINALSGKSIGLGQDVSKLEAVRSEIERIRAEINSFSGKGLVGQGFKNALSDLDNWKKYAHDAMKEQSALNNEYKKSVAEQNKVASAERQQNEAISRAEQMLRNIEALTARSNALKVDTSTIEQARQMVQDLLRRFENFSGKGLLSNEFKDALSDLRQAKLAVNQVLKEQSSANKAAKAANDEEANSLKKTANEANKAEIAYNNLKNTIERANKAQGNGLKLFDDINDTAKIRQALSALETLRSNLEQIKNSGIGVHPVTGVTASQYLSSADFVNTLNNAKLAISEQEKQNSAQERINRSKSRTNSLENEHAKLLKQSSAVQAQLVKGFERANSHAGKLNSTVQDLKSLFLQGGLVFGAQQFAMSIITTGGEMEKQHIALQSILGDIQNANTMFNQIKELALNSPFTFSELNRDVKQLAAYGVEYDQLYDTTKRLADMSSGLGVSFDRIALAFGQVQARGWLDGKELRQIAYAGIPLLNKLSEFYSKQEGRNVSTSEIKTRISNRDVSFDDVKSIFWQMTNEGGQFYNMQQTLSETLLGRYNKLKDAWEIMLADFANGKNVIGSTFKDIIELVTNLVQSIHTIGPAIAAVFAGPLLKKGLVAMDGGLGKSILTSKAGVASDITSRVMQGQKISAVEKKILATKNQITLADIKNLARANALNKAELQRLFISGRITKEMYQQGIALTKQVSQSKQLSLWGAAKNLFSGSGFGAAGGLLLGGLKSVGSSILGFFGGLPGIAISAGMSIFAYYEQKNAQLKHDMDTTADELKDRYKNISEFLRDNDADKALNDGDEKNIENLIDAYKEKLKEIAPEKENAFEMSLTEKKSNEERLRYLKQQLELLKQIEAESKKKLSNEDAYKNFDSLMSGAKSVSESYSVANAKTNAVNATNSDFRTFEVWKSKYEEQIRSMRSLIIDELGDISKDPKLQGEANQIMSSFFSKQGWDQNVADQFRADVLNSMGVSTNFYENKFKSALENAVNTTYPWIGDKIRNNQELTDAEKIQVNNLMKDAAAQVERDYPLASDALKRMLAADRFEAVIHLVFDKQESDLVKQLGKNLKGDGYDYHEKNKIVGSWGKDAGDSYNKAKSNAQADITATKKELDDRRRMLKLGNLTLDEFNKTQKQYELKVSAYRDEWGELFTGDEKKTGGKKGGHKNTGGVKTDKALTDLRKRIDLYKKMYAEIKKFKDLYGVGALGQLANDGEFEAIFEDKKRFPLSDYGNYEKSIKELLNTLPSNTQERRDYKASEKAGIQTKNRKLLEDARKDELNTLNKQLSAIQEQYDVYKKIYELTGNKRGSENIAFGGIVQFDSYKKFLEEQLDIARQHDNVQSGLDLSLDEVKSLDLDNIKDQYGEDSRTYDIKKQLEDENKKIKSETINLMADLIEKNVTIEQQIEDENRKYERQLELVKGIEDPQMRQRAQEGAEKTHNETTAKLQFEQFKQGSDWVTIFDDLNRVSSTTINSMVDKIDDFSKKTGLSVEVVKQLREALSKLRDEQIERNPVAGIIGGMQRGNAIGSFIGSRFRKGMDISTTTYVGAKDAKKMGIKEGNYTRGQLENEQKGAYDDANKGVTGLANKFKALQDCLDPVISLFDALGMEDTALGVGMSTTSSAFGAASQVSGGLNALGLSSLGPYGAAAGAALSVTSSLFALHDKAIQKEIEASEARQKEMENLTKNVKSVIQSTLGGVYNYKATASTKKSISDAYNRLATRDSISKGNSFFSKLYKLTDQETKAMQDLKKAMDNPDNAYQSQLASLQAQKMELEKQRSLEEDKKKKDKTKIADYNQQIIEMEQQIDTFKEDFLKDVYSIDMKSWASELTDAVVGAWENGEDAVDAYKEKVKSMVKDLTKNIIAQKYIEKMMEGPLKTLTDYLDTHNGVLDEGVIKKFADQVAATADEAVPTITKIFDALKNAGLDLRENGSSSASNSIKGITEETADILASYLNAIRLDVSVIREMQGTFMPEMSEIAKSQLTQLNLIAQNTLRNADAAERIEKIFIEYNDNFNRVINGTKSLKMK